MQFHREAEDDHLGVPRHLGDVIRDDDPAVPRGARLSHGPHRITRLRQIGCQRCSHVAKTDEADPSHLAPSAPDRHGGPRISRLAATAAGAPQ